MFDVDEFVERCRGAGAQSTAAVREVVERTVAEADAVAAAMVGHKGVTLLHHSPDLTVLSVVIPPGLARTLPHDHAMWAVVGVYGGQEDNSFFRRDGNTLADSGGRSLSPGDSIAMGADTIHAIENPTSHESLGALHVYGGDLITAERRMWTMPDLTEAPYDDVAVLGAKIS